MNPLLSHLGCIDRVWIGVIFRSLCVYLRVGGEDRILIHVAESLPEGKVFAKLYKELDSPVKSSNSGHSEVRIVVVCQI